MSPAALTEDEGECEAPQPIQYPSVNKLPTEEKQFKRSNLVVYKNNSAVNLVFSAVT